MQNLFNEAVQACTKANELSNQLGALNARLEELSTDTASAVEVACATGYAWFISTNRKHGGKKQLSDASGVSATTVGRWLASGHVALVTDNKITATTVNSAISNYNMKLSEVEAVKTVTEWRDLLKTYKAVSKAGKAKAKAEAEAPEAEATEAPKPTGKGWKSHAEALTAEISAGNVGLMEVMDYLTELVSGLGLDIDNMIEV